MSKIAIVEGDKSIVRDLTSNAILSVDKTALSVHRAHRRFVQLKEEEMNQLKDQVSELTKLVQTLISSNDK